MDGLKLSERKTCVICIGIPASGKSTFSVTQLPGFLRINLDQLHTRAREKKIFEKALTDGTSFVIDNTNISAKDRQRYISPAKDAGYRIVGLYFKSSIQECIERNKGRLGTACVPDAAIKYMGKSMELPDYSEGFDELYHIEMGPNSYVISEWRSDENEI